MNRARTIKRLANTAHQYLYLSNMPTHIQLDAYRICLRRIRDDLRQLFIEMTDEDPWDLHSTHKED